MEVLRGACYIKFMCEPAKSTMVMWLSIPFAPQYTNNLKVLETLYPYMYISCIFTLSDHDVYFGYIQCDALERELQFHNSVYRLQVSYVESLFDAVRYDILSGISDKGLCQCDRIKNTLLILFDLH